MVSTSTINTVPQARALAAQLSTSPRYSHETQPVFGSGKVVGFIVRLKKKDNRGVTVASLILRDEEAQDFAQAVKLAKNDVQIQWLIQPWFAEAN